MVRRIIALPALAAVAAAGLTACSGGKTPAPTASSPQSATQPPSPASGAGTQAARTGVDPNAPENNPPGDIPDSTVYVPYRSSTGHFEFTYPQGWARTQVPEGVRFSGNLNSVAVRVAHRASAPSAASVRTSEIPRMSSGMKGFSLTAVQQATLPAGHAVEISYQSQSTPNAVTGKSVKNKAERFDFFKGGTEVSLTLAGPVGADNVDPWRTMSRSFRWLK